MNEGLEGNWDRQQGMGVESESKGAIGGPFYFSGERVSAKSPECVAELCKSLLRGAPWKLAAAKEHEDAITGRVAGDDGAAGVGGRRCRAQETSARKTSQPAAQEAPKDGAPVALTLKTCD